MICRSCGNDKFIPFADLQNCPPSNAMLTRETLDAPEIYYPLVVEVCTNCYLVQVGEHKAAAEIFDSNYTYFSSYSSSWLDHCRRFAATAAARFELGAESQVIEIASNDGYLLQYFRDAGVPVLGVEPTANTAAVAVAKGIPTRVDFFGERFAEVEFQDIEHQADLLIGNNVFAHVPDINDFTAGLRRALKPGGVISLEFPHLLRLIDDVQFDTIYHEHFSYLSLSATQTIFARHGLTIFDVEELPTHGGSLRIFGTHADEAAHATSPAVAELAERERAAGLADQATYAAFQPRIDEVRATFLSFLLEARAAGKVVAGYGAAAKGNTLLNYCGIKGAELVRCVADASPHKQGKFLPGSHIPVVSPEALRALRPDYVVIFPWNLKREIMEQLADIHDWGGQFVTAIPGLSIA